MDWNGNGNGRTLTVILANSLSKYGNGRSLLQRANTTSGIPRQSNNFARIDPLDGFKKYKGGFNITNRHYWSSTTFNGVYGYAIGTVWFLSGLIYGVFLLAARSYCRVKSVLRKKHSYPNRHCCICCILIVVFTIRTM